ncbi:MAG: SLBB domain-containing protein [Acidobacteria bacterium]|nr:SLBB domain-containing protein [Acidobacteriota bacterium]
MSKLSEAARNAGLIGLGGGGFPSHIKTELKYNTVIANAVECEPLMYSDYHLLNKYTDDFIKGLNLVSESTGASRSIIAIKKKRSSLIKLLQEKITKNIEIFPMDDYYPAGDEFITIYDSLGVIIPHGKFPSDSGILVNNAATITGYSLASQGIPLTKRFVTVTGAVTDPVTVEAPIGTPFSYLLDLAGGPTVKDFAIMAGGVMMGSLSTVNDTVLKTTSGIVILPSDHPVILEQKADIEKQYRIARSVCDQCYTCSEYCPRLKLGHNIQPHKIMRMISFNLEHSHLSTSSVNYCCSCGLCSLYACPLGISPRRVIQSLKTKKLKSLERVEMSSPDPFFEYKRVPVSRLLKKLRLDEYNAREDKLFEGAVRPDYVILHLKQGAGAASEAIVKTGQKVKTGDLIAQAANDPMSVPLHASIDGNVLEVTGEYIKIGRQEGR